MKASLTAQEANEPSADDALLVNFHQYLPQGADLWEESAAITEDVKKEIRDAGYAISEDLGFIYFHWHYRKDKTPKKIITVRTAAQEAGVSFATVYSWIREQKFRAEKRWNKKSQSNQWDIDHDDFLVFLQVWELGEERCAPTVWIDSKQAASILGCSTTTVHRYATEYDHFSWSWGKKDGTPIPTAYDTPWPGNGYKRLYKKLEVIEFKAQNLEPLLADE